MVLKNEKEIENKQDIEEIEYITKEELWETFFRYNHEKEKKMLRYVDKTLEEYIEIKTKNGKVITSVTLGLDGKILEGGKNNPPELCNKAIILKEYPVIYDTDVIDKVARNKNKYCQVIQNENRYNTFDVKNIDMIEELTRRFKVNSNQYRNIINFEIYYGDNYIKEE
ncbi:permease-like cell division protein FtsX [Methanococcus voltae]|uniref:FtsX extracellular domain-containing protein n=2 Tax=Methanococcus voltae TaxID=2188 RepID=A0A8J7RLX7_METVO|nr:permease-like cell division protein FtsX [Methanococcus voltae]MBP2171816.1 hypothetical protein [Methanococcus voltae]MBP2201246.1 hypothetical protein [Methanococcus voltae]MCS3922812.1 hypothetical protein [Methanococcus voltae PS]